jgi:carbamoyltransferase
MVIEDVVRRIRVPLILNTSYNLRGEPIAHRPEEAMADSLTTGMEALLPGNFLLEKSDSVGA